MENYTKTGLLMLLIAEIIAVIANIVMYSFWYSFNLEQITSENLSSIFLTIIPAAAIGIIGGIILLIGAILMLLGRKEFGEKHRQYIFYALIIYVISIVISVVFTVITLAMTFSSFGQMSISDPSNAQNLLQNSNYMLILYVNTILATAIGGLIWIFGLYQLENKTGRIALFFAYICMIATTVIVAIISLLFFEDFINSGADSSSSISQLSSSYQWIGNSAIFSLIGGTITGVLLIIAIYIPYKRITTGELMPVTHTADSSYGKTGGSDRICTNCSREIPFDANNCPYCGKKFESFI